MNELDPEKLFEDFLNDWEREFKKAHEKINYLSSYAEEQLGALWPGDELCYKKRVKVQTEWLFWLDRMDEPEKKFYKNCWMIYWGSDNEMRFIDLSRKDLPIIGGDFYWHKPFGWYLIQYFSSIDDLIDKLDTGITRQELEKLCQKFRMDAYRKEHYRLNMLMYKGNIPMFDLEPEDIFLEDLKHEIHDLREGGLFCIRNVGVLSLGLLPYDLDIRLNSVNYDYDVKILDEDIDKVSKVRHLVLLIKDNGQMNLNNIHFNITPEQQVFYNEKRELIFIGIENELKGLVTNKLESIARKG